MWERAKDKFVSQLRMAGIHMYIHTTAKRMLNICIDLFGALDFGTKWYYKYLEQVSLRYRVCTIYCLLYVFRLNQ